MKFNNLSHITLAMVVPEEQAAIGWLPTAETRIKFRVISSEIRADDVALEHFPLRVLRFPSANHFTVFPYSC
jgi:hypothetical protein